MRKRNVALSGLLAGLFLSSGLARAGGETGVFWIARCKGFYGETTVSVLSDPERRAAVADGMKENNVALAAYLKFVEAWNEAHKRPREQARDGRPVRNPASNPGSTSNIELQKPGRKTLAFDGPYPTRAAATAELAPPGGSEPVAPQAAALAAPVLVPGKGGAWDYQYSLFLAEVEKLKKTPAASNSLHQGDDPRVKKMGGLPTRSLTDPKKLSAPPPDAGGVTKH